MAAARALARMLDVQETGGEPVSDIQWRRFLEETREAARWNSKSRLRQLLRLQSFGSGCDTMKRVASQLFLGKA